MRPFLTPFVLALSLALNGCGSIGTYGPAQDYSRFEGAALMPDDTAP